MRPIGAHPVYWRTFEQSPPDGWKLTRFRDLASSFKGKLPKDLSSTPIPGGMPYLLVEGFETSEWNYTSDVTLPKITESDSVVVADGSRSGWTLRGKAGALGSTLLCYQPKEGVDPDFLFYLLQSFYAFTNTATIGGAVPHLDTRLLNNLSLFVPGIQEEQASIGARLKAVDETISAAEAKLTAARRLKTALMQQLFTRGIPGRHSRFKIAAVFRLEFEAPRAWAVEALRESVTAIEYGTNAASNDGQHGLPVVAIPEVVAPRFQLGECSYAEVPDTEAEALRLRSDDVLLIRTNGNPDYIGKSTVIGHEALNTHMIFASYLIRVQTDKEKLSGRYLNYFLASPLGRRQCLAMANTSAGNHNLGSRAIKQFILPRPSREEQSEIVALLDSAEDTIEAVQAEIESLNRLKRSLLQNLLTGRVRVRLEAQAAAD